MNEKLLDLICNWYMRTKYKLPDDGKLYASDEAMEFAEGVFAYMLNHLEEPQSVDTWGKLFQEGNQNGNSYWQ